MGKAELLVLSKAEQAEKDRLERVVDEGKASFVAVGMALAEIKRHPEWYAPQSFESYAETRFGLKAAYAGFLRRAALIAEAVWGDSYNCREIPAKAEGTLRPLTRLLDKRGQDEVCPEQRDRIEAAWARACKLAEDEGCAVAGRHVKAAVDEALGVRKEESRGVALDIARAAAGKLNEIHANDPGRAEAFAFLRRWLDAHEA